MTQSKRGWTVTVQFDLTASFVAALTGSPETVMNWRALHDTDKGAHGHSLRAPLSAAMDWMTHYQSHGCGIFAAVSALDDSGQTLAHVQAARAHFVDLDNDAAPANLQRAAVWTPSPSFVVHSSPGKHHVYWPVLPYNDNARFTAVQRKLVRLFDGDPSAVDPTRVMRVPGTWHLKNPHQPHLVTCEALAGYGVPLPVEHLEHVLAGITLEGGGAGDRHPLGHPDLAAPDLASCVQALMDADPNAMTHSEWAAFTASWKQAVWSHVTETQARAHWDTWCARYRENNVAANDKLWRSLTDTSSGWPTLRRRSPSAMFTPTVPTLEVPALSMPDPSQFGELLMPEQLSLYFKDVYRIMGQPHLITPHGIMRQTEFNVAYGGHRFIITSDAMGGEKVKSAWDAATNSTVFHMPVAHEARFLPDRPWMERVERQDGFVSINTFRAPTIPRLQGDASRWVQHMMQLIGNADDCNVLFDYLAHNLLYPGYKIPWAPFVQSAEGAGKNAVALVMERAFNRYYHKPKVSDLAGNGAKFNDWMRERLFILADEIMVWEDRRELMEIFKEWISEHRIEVQGKGVGQQMIDNRANWMFFSNYQSALPISRQARRYAPFFSPLQSVGAIEEAGMGAETGYFASLYGWLEHDGGAEIVLDWLMSRPVAKGGIPMRAPKTASSEQAWKLAQSPIERLVHEAVEDQAPGFKGGFVGTQALRARIRASGAVNARTITEQTLQNLMETMGYVDCGMSPSSFLQEGSGDLRMKSRVYHLGGRADPALYGRTQGWD